MKLRGSRNAGETLSSRIRNEGLGTTGNRLKLIAQLSAPSIMAQLSAIIMGYIDSAMVGSLGAEASASIGLIATSTWLFMGLCSAASAGFCVQVAHQLGSGNPENARSVLRQSLTATLLFSLILTAVGSAIAEPLPRWLGGNEAINHGATVYFRIFIFSLPVLQYSFLAGGMLRSSGNTLVPGMLSALMCVLDVVFNFFLIFPSRPFEIFGTVITIPGAGFGVMGAALGTMLAEVVATALMMRHLLLRSTELQLKGTRGSFIPQKQILKRTLRIAFPMGLERFISSAAQITITAIVAPLGAFAIAANNFAVTAESLCYMPGYGIADAAQTLVGQSLGAGRRDLAEKFARLTIGMGMVVMTVMGIIMYLAAPIIIGLLTPVPEILELGVQSLRIEAWAEPMFAASIVAYGAFVGAGDTFIPCCLNLGSMWVIRITLAAILAPSMGLAGVWLAMCIELCCRGTFFLLRLRSGRWMNRIHQLT